MSKYDKNNFTGEEHFLRTNSTNALHKNEDDGAVGFEQSLKAFSSSDVVKHKRKRKRKLGINGIIRLIALCVCIGVLVFSLSKIMERTNDLSEAKRVYDSLLSDDTGSAIPKLKPARAVSFSKDLLTFLGSDSGGIEMVDTETRNYYEMLREQVLAIQKVYPDCIGYITVSGTKISYPIMKTTNNDYYLRHLYNGEYSKAGSIYADYRMDDDYNKNMNTVIYGHCMSDGTMFRGIKLFFDSEYRYSQAQEMKITVVTADAVYIYDYFSGYRSEGAYFISVFKEGQSTARYYTFLRNIRARNTIAKDVGYNSNSKIITLVTCTNLSSKPDERYVLHGILDEYFEFEG